jgi:U3 small nucleolar ribonucleoprotein protein IMP4
MTFVTTSRKAAPEVRSLAKDLAFALGLRYIKRGKQGLSDLNSIDPLFIIFSTEFRGTRMQGFSDGKVFADYLVREQSVLTREDQMRKGLSAGDQSVYDTLKPYIPVAFSEDSVYTLIFDGTRSHRYLIRLEPYGT